MLNEVQHDIAAASLPSVMRLLTDWGIRASICVRSSVMLSRDASLRSHSIRRLYNAGVSVTIKYKRCSDVGHTSQVSFRRSCKQFYSVGQN